MSIVTIVNIVLSIPQGLFRDSFQHWVGYFIRLLVARFIVPEVMSYEYPLM